LTHYFANTADSNGIAKFEKGGWLDDSELVDYGDISASRENLINNADSFGGFFAEYYYEK
jgi:hypothetical protein